MQKRSRGESGSPKNSSLDSKEIFEAFATEKSMFVDNQCLMFEPSPIALPSAYPVRLDLDSGRLDTLLPLIDPPKRFLKLSISLPSIIVVG